MNRPAAVRAVEDEQPELALKIGLHLQELEAQHLRLERDGMRAVEAGGKSFVDERFVLRGCSLSVRTARSRMSRSCRAMPGCYPRKVARGVGRMNPRRPRRCSERMTGYWVSLGLTGPALPQGRCLRSDARRREQPPNGRGACVSVEDGQDIQD